MIFLFSSSTSVSQQRMKVHSSRCRTKTTIYILPFLQQGIATFPSSLILLILLYLLSCSDSESFVLISTIQQFQSLLAFTCSTSTTTHPNHNRSRRAIPTTITATTVTKAKSRLLPQFVCGSSSDSDDTISNDDDDEPSRTEQHHATMPQQPPLHQYLYPRHHHHVAIKTSNITRAMAFYSLLGYSNIEIQFRTGSARACWITTSSNNDDDDNNKNTSNPYKSRLELIEVPAYMLQQQQYRAPDVMQYPTLLGYNHVALDVTEQIQQYSQQYRVQQDNHIHDDDAKKNDFPSLATGSLWTYIQQLNQTSMERFNKTLRMVPLSQPTGIRFKGATTTKTNTSNRTPSSSSDLQQQQQQQYVQQQMIGSYIYEIAFLYDADGALIELLYCSGTRETSTLTSGWEPWDSTTFVQ